MIERYEYCKCKECRSVTTGFEDSFGFWDVCMKCKKRLEDGYHYYNHYDGEDHIEYWGRNGEFEF